MDENLLSVIFRDKPENAYIYLWNFPSKKSLFFQDVQEAAQQARQSSKGGEDVYFGLSFANEPVAANKRIKANGSAGICCLWADVDYGPGHAKDVPLDEKTTTDLLKKALHPSLVVHTGHGFHCYWLMEQPLVIESDEDRQEAADMLFSWQAYLRRIFKAEGYDLDATHDLARVLRVEGTKNYKTKPPLDVKYYWPKPGDIAECHRYSIDKLISLAGRHKKKSSAPATTIITADLVLDPKAEYDSHKFLALFSNSQEFADTWNHKRPDLKDVSPSGYDLALANYAAAAGWSDQDIANLVIHWRREHGHNINKALRGDYVKRTISKARYTALVEAGDDDDINPIEAGAELTDEKRAGYLKNVEESLKFPIARAIRQGSENTQYSIILPDGGEITLGRASSLLNLTQFRAKVFDMTGIAVPQITQKKWHKICQIFHQIAEFIDDKSSEAEQGQEWLDQYLDDNRLYTGDEWLEQVKKSQPFARNGRVYVNANHLCRYVNLVMQLRSVNSGDIRRILRRIGFETGDVTGRDGEKKVIHKRYWSRAKNA